MQHLLKAIEKHSGTRADAEPSAPRPGGARKGRQVATVAAWDDEEDEYGDSSQWEPVHTAGVAEAVTRSAPRKPAKAKAAAKSSGTITSEQLLSVFASIASQAQQGNQGTTGGMQGSPRNPVGKAVSFASGAGQQGGNNAVGGEHLGPGRYTADGVVICDTCGQPGHKRWQFPRKDGQAGSGPGKGMGRGPAPGRGPSGRHGAYGGGGQQPAAHASTVHPVVYHQPAQQQYQPRQQHQQTADAYHPVAHGQPGGGIPWGEPEEWCEPAGLGGARRGFNNLVLEDGQYIEAEIDWVADAVETIEELVCGA